MENLCKIRDIYRSILDFENEFQVKFSLNLNEGILLCTLGKQEKISSGKLAERIALSCSNCSKVIVSAEKKGFIKRILGEGDKRQMYFILTEKGGDLLKEIQKNENYFAEFLTKLQN